MLLLLVLVGAAVPLAHAADDCARATPCVPLSTSVISDQASAVPTRTYYLYGAALLCNPPAAGLCAGYPGPIVAGILYEETNGQTGLQRFPTVSAPQPDVRVLL